MRDRLGRHERNLAAFERRMDDGEYLPRRPLVPDPEFNRSPPGNAQIAAASDQRDPVFHQFGIRDDDRHVVHRRQRRVTPANADDFAGDAVDFNPVADAAGVVELQRNAAKQIAERGLRREADDRGQCRRRDADRGQVHAQRIHPEQRVHDQRDSEAHFAEDARHGTARQQHAGYEGDEDADDADRDDQQADLARNDRDGQLRRDELIARQQREPGQSEHDDEQGDRHRPPQLRPEAHRDQTEEQSYGAEPERFLQRDRLDHRRCFPRLASGAAASRGLYGPASVSPNHARMPSRTSRPTCPEHAHRWPHTR